MPAPTPPTVASNANPVPAPSQAESEVAVTPPAAQPSSAGAPATTSASSEPASVSAAAASFLPGVSPLMDTLSESLQSIPPSQSAHHAKIGPVQLRVISMVLTMLEENPTLSGVTPDAINAVMNDVAACAQLNRFFTAGATLSSSTGRLRIEYGWQICSGILAAARKQAPLSATIAKDVAAIDAVLAKGPKSEQAAKVAVDKTAKATKATARATKAQTEATEAAARATALQHGTGDATITTPAPAAGSSAAPSTTAPSPSATPATPGTVPIR